MLFNNRKLNSVRLYSK